MTKDMSLPERFRSNADGLQEARAQGIHLLAKDFRDAADEIERLERLCGLRDTDTSYKCTECGAWHLKRPEQTVAEAVADINLRAGYRSGKLP